MVRMANFHFSDETLGTLADDPEIVAAACKSFSPALKFASARLNADTNFILSLIEEVCTGLRAGEQLRRKRATKMKSE